MCRGVVGFVKGSCRARQVKKATLWSALSCKHRCRVCHTVSVMTGCYNTGLGTTFPEFEKPRKPTHSSLLSSRCSVGRSSFRPPFCLRGHASVAWTGDGASGLAHMRAPACGLLPLRGRGLGLRPQLVAARQRPDIMPERSQSVAISGNQWSSTVINGHQRSSAARHQISGHQRSSAVISGHHA